MSFARITTLARLELTQRLRSVGWYVLLGVFVLLLIGITLLSFMVFSFQSEPNAGVYSIVVNFVLLLVVLVSPTLSGNAINGDREAATLAPVQVTAATTGDIMLGKLLAAVATGSIFLLIAVPFLLISMLGGGVTAGMLIVSLLVLLAEIIVVAAIGVGLSGLIARPLFSIATTYLAVAALVVGTLIAFGLGGTAIQSEARGYERPWDETTGEPVCDEWVEVNYNQPRFDLVWGFLAANPFVVLADATPTTFSHGYPNDLFGQVKVGVRLAQLPPEIERWDACENGWIESPTSQEQIEDTVPSWFVGLGLQALIAGGLFAGAWARTRTPARRLPPGTRIA
ncbi:ABC transporter permease [Microbacterium esteraromaticum]|uniref:ABC transporter permease n=1 Tax=Microbacterium TaxID=33882 RepID=UPI0019D38780|nr:ABC transporter permease [Microbacterium esteraromaticum]MBN7793321.1 ABC transporter permease [Microbacterium esteraromaticum]MCA1305563.1 ABC transporter permease [Microbacterium esteraromaticum]WDH79548.1 ABC transporter permease [Microbacterium esteraromaticum]